MHVGADAPVRPPRRRRGTLFRIHRKCCFLQRRCNCAFGDHIFSLLREKIWKKRALGTRNSAYARKNTSLHSLCYRYTCGQGTPFGRRPRKLHIPRCAASGKARPFRCSSFPKPKRYAGLCFGFFRASVFAPVEYLTYGSRGASDIL